MSQVGNPISNPDMDNQYEKLIFFSKEALEDFEKEDPQVRKACMQIIEENIAETKAKIEKEMVVKDE